MALVRRYIFGFLNLFGGIFSGIGAKHAFQKVHSDENVSLMENCFEKLSYIISLSYR
jgi:hypothetical protein